MESYERFVLDKLDAKLDRIENKLDKILQYIEDEENNKSEYYKINKKVIDNFVKDNTITLKDW
jgi:vacuolar-type H+-ATPase subunit I/STV1